MFQSRYVSFYENLNLVNVNYFMCVREGGLCGPALRKKKVYFIGVEWNGYFWRGELWLDQH